jgi:hypothetical protein
MVRVAYAYHSSLILECAFKALGGEYEVFVFSDSVLVNVSSMVHTFTRGVPPPSSGVEERGCSSLHHKHAKHH